MIHRRVANVIVNCWCNTSRVPRQQTIDPLTRRHNLNFCSMSWSLLTSSSRLGYYVKNGQSTDEIASIRTALRRLRLLFGTMPARKFGPKAYKVVRTEMIQAGLSRKYINDSMARIRRMFRWAVSEELLPPSVYQRLVCVPGLRRGRSAARDSDPVLPVSDEHFLGTLPYMPFAFVADMAQVQRLTGCRPQEICLLRGHDIDRTGDVWEYAAPGDTRGNIAVAAGLSLSVRCRGNPRTLPVHHRFRIVFHRATAGAGMGRSKVNVRLGSHRGLVRSSAAGSL